MGACSVLKDLKIEPGSIKDYESLAQFHYRSGRPGPYCAIYAIKPAVGVIVYQMPGLNCEMRSAVLGNVLKKLPQIQKNSWINSNIRCISRVVIEPRYRGLGLAHRLVRETMGLLRVPIIEAMAVMGTINPFFEKAGMKAYKGKNSLRCERITEALSIAGIEQDDLVDASAVQRKIEMLDSEKREFIEKEIGIFLRACVRHRNMPAGYARTSEMLGRITQRPVYYLWVNQKIEVI